MPSVADGGEIRIWTACSYKKGETVTEECGWGVVMAYGKEQNTLTARAGSTMTIQDGHTYPGPSAVTTDREWRRDTYRTTRMT